MHTLTRLRPLWLARNRGGLRVLGPIHGVHLQIVITRVGLAHYLVWHHNWGCLVQRHEGLGAPSSHHGLDCSPAKHWLQFLFILRLSTGFVVILGAVLQVNYYKILVSDCQDCHEMSVFLGLLFSTLVASCGLWYNCVSALHKEELDGPDIVAVDCDDNGITVFGSRVALDPLGSGGR